MTPIYIRTDKNGTRIYHDYTCPRCGGAGQADKWRFTGCTCYECGGSGKRNRPKIIKEYTAEYAAKLAAKQAAKAAKEAEAMNDPKRQEELREANRRALEFRYAENGCGKDGIGYVLNGNTYKIKDEIRKNGGRWVYGVWVCPVEIKANGVRPVRIDLSEAFSGDNGIYAHDIIWDARD